MGPDPSDPERALKLRLDHLIYGVGDLDAAARRFAEEYGLGSVPGGRHRGWGTANAIVPLGDEYVELVGVVDEEEARGTAFGDWVRLGAAEGDRLLGWAIATDDVAAVATRLDVAVTEGGRTRPDGTELSWRLAGFDRMLSDSAFPIFIEWRTRPEDHPGRIEAAHRVAPQRIAWISVGGDERAVWDWLGEDHGLPVRVKADGSGIIEAAIDTADGEVVLR